MATDAPKANGDAAPAAEKLTKPARPDDDLFKKSLEAAEKEHKAVMAKYKRRQELISQLNEIRQKQAGFKNARASKMDQIKRLDEQLKSRIAEQKTARTRVPYKGLDDLDRQIADLERKVDSGTLKIVDEKKALSDISSMKKMRKSFAGFDDAQKQIDQLKAKIKEIKDTQEDPEQKALSENYNKLQKELDEIKAQSDEAYKSLGSLRDERTKLQAEQQEKFQAIRKIKDDYYNQKRAFSQFEKDARDKARERQRAERDRIVKERKKADAERLLQEASDPAFLEEIRRANSLLRFLDPSAAPAEKAPLLAESGLAAQAQRKVDDAGLKGMKLVKKEDREDEYLPAVKKGKKGKKGGAPSLPPRLSTALPPSSRTALTSVLTPMSAAEVPDVIEKVQAKLNDWKANQAAQTQKNVEKAKKEIARLEAEEAAEADGDAKVEKLASDLEATAVKE
ncbi:unnamed protein product [Parascedosporium putredinis]|uniref:Nuclear segregation protein n=1 Tax=Parascedosporium putredinis TaxID=1442378 RepID=A0A9P1GW03_9PEZI|nr:unnamed protein product [Parascedosporium putredinis]CAI7988406.1 unnamed protein product [Parascedosporium putredinis]